MKKYFEDLMYGRRRSLLVGLFLSMLAFVYRSALSVRDAWYSFPWTRKVLPCKVISVGNITIGGTGKTPAVIDVAALLLRNGKHPVVISRGYGRPDESSLAVVSDGLNVQNDTVANGDEPVLIAARLTGVPVVVGSDRYRAARFALERFASDVVVLDDGFQHRRLGRDCDIVLVDASDPFGNGKLFPAGILREQLSALRRAHVILITRSESGADNQSLRSVLHRYTAAPIFTSSHVPLDLTNVITNETRPLSSLRGARALAFSGIARPSAFQALLETLGVQIRAARIYPDHHAYDKADLADIFQQAADEKVNMIITTEKDAVRLKTLRPEGIWALRIRLKVVEADEWEQMLAGII